MPSEVEWPDSVIGEAWHEYRYPQPAVDEPTDRFMRAARVFQAASRAAVAAELERAAESLPNWNCGSPAYVDARNHAKQHLLARASELRGEGKDTE